MYKNLSQDGLRQALSGAQEIYVSGCSAEIAELPMMLAHMPGLKKVTGIFSPILNVQSYANAESGLRCRTFFLNGRLRKDLIAGVVDLCPWSYSQIDGWLTAPGRFDAAIVMVSPPGPDGRCSFGTQADFLPAFYDRIPRLIGVINPNMPRTYGEEGIPLERFYEAYSYDRPLLGFESPVDELDPISNVIGNHIADLVPDGATVQMGIGRVPQAVALGLRGHKNLRIHSGLIDNNTLVLEESGALSPDNAIVSGVAMGSSDLYRHISGNRRYEMRSASHTHSSDVVASLPHFTSINGAIELDLFGQVNSEGANGKILATPGGLSDFLGGASRSPGGQSIFAVRAKPGRKGQGGIMPQIGEPRLVTVPRARADIVVTENGVARLKHLSVDARAEALIAIADAGQQQFLLDAWREIRATLFA